MSLLASLAACVSISVDGMTAVRNVWIKLGAQEWGDKNSTDLLNEAIEAHAPDYHPLPADTDIKMVCLAGTRHDRGLSQDCTAFLLEAVTDTLAFLETRTVTIKFDCQRPASSRLALHNPFVMMMMPSAAPNPESHRRLPTHKVHSFLCGMQPFDDDHPLHGVLVTRSNITCGSPVEFEYYSTQTKRATWFDATTCAWCAGVHGEGTISQILQDLWHTVLPLCEYCKSQVAKPLVRAQRRMAAEREEASRKRAARADKQRQDKEQAEQPAEEAAQPQQQPRQPRNARSSRGRKPRTANQPVTRRRSTRQYAAGI